MSAQQIPNLLSLRGGPRSRGRGRGQGLRDPLNPHSEVSSNRRDNAIQGTDTDAAVSRLSAVNLGYLEDPFARYFVNGSGTRRLPIINRGTYSRTTALDLLIETFLSQSENSTSQRKQIISLGAGTDTRYFRLRAKNLHKDVIYHEFDFPSVCAAKNRLVQQNHAELIGTERFFEMGQSDSEIAQPMMATGTQGSREWGLGRTIDGHSEVGYVCHPLDLRKLPAIVGLDSFHGIKCDLPTLIVSECCLCYLEVDVAQDVIKWFTNKIPSIGIVLYEPVGVHDAFGQMMVENLASRGIVMPTVQKYKTLKDQKDRLVGLGFGTAEGGINAVSIENVWEDWVAGRERERVDRLEGLDEVEEWLLLARHYSVVWGWTVSSGFERLKALNP
ncbi:83e3d3e9-4c85-4ed9-8f21-6410cc421a9e [Sclerotinia trifoliorum]|uniref:Leucine carboxyl methyltransferase 1 n=1 Tax=Sclerotinia trifoliorum TaxID=28548 RepID=A0A8H2VZV4_9HELO|nr:83e3d3e9-4c85-4ed9-8f21-6410cc421a9e [Sclerotinia trifoliorum]